MHWIEFSAGGLQKLITNKYHAKVLVQKHFIFFIYENVLSMTINNDERTAQLFLGLELCVDVIALYISCRATGNETIGKVNVWFQVLSAE